DQHFFVHGATAKLRAPVYDDISSSLAEWTQRHNRWSDAEVAETLAPSAGVVSAAAGRDPVRRKRALRAGYNRLPKFFRAFSLFGYRYFVRGGFMDGIEGLIFFVLQTFWFRFLVDAKIHEATRG